MSAIDTGAPLLPTPADFEASIRRKVHQTRDALLTLVSAKLLDMGHKPDVIKIREPLYVCTDFTCKLDDVCDSVCASLEAAGWTVNRCTLESNNRFTNSTEIRLLLDLELDAPEDRDVASDDSESEPDFGSVEVVEVAPEVICPESESEEVDTADDALTLVGQEGNEKEPGVEVIKVAQKTAEIRKAEEPVKSFVLQKKRRLWWGGRE
ncbi:hypothetical protein HKX48_004237 [Thoreauomyces humboldtii]|nr:hypothetical protein HKX48_004237 [Thoreauomyces humboldtii]